MKVVSVFNQAGGVGKTSITLNVGYHLAKMGLKVLLLDNDPQASLTLFMGVNPSSLGVEQSSVTAIINENPLPIMIGVNGMDLAPTSIELAHAEVQLAHVGFREIRIKDAIASVIDSYDIILIDCAPSLGLLSYLALVASTHILIPIQTHFKAFQGTNTLIQTIAEVRKKGNPTLEILGIIPTLYGNTGQDKSTYEAIQQDLARLKIFPPIPRATAFADAAEMRLPLALFKPRHPAVKILEEIALGVKDG